MPLPSTFNPIHRFDPGWLINPQAKKQTNPQTVLADGDLTAVFPFEGDPVLRRSDTIRSDINMTGKGHPFATPANHKQVARDIDGTRTFQMNSSLAGILASLGMGSVSSAQPNAGGNPTAYRHTIKFLNPLSAGRHAPVTTIYEQLADVSGWRKKIRACAVNRLTFSGSARDPVQIAADIVTSGEDVEDAVTVPAVGTFDVLDGDQMVFKIGNLGAGADISDRLASWRVVIAQNIDVVNGKFPGSAKYSERFWIGAQRVEEISIDLFVRAADADIRDLWANDTKQEVSFKLSGSQIGGGPEKHDVEIFFPSLRIPAPNIGLNGDWEVYQLRISPDRIYKDAAASIVEPVQITVTNITTAYLI